MFSHNLENKTGRCKDVILNNRICKLYERDLEDELRIFVQYFKEVLLANTIHIGICTTIKYTQCP